MCIIAYAPKGATISEKTIREMFKYNPDGAGIMWKPSDKSNVEIRKGFMKVDDLLNAWKKVPQKCEKAIHCRIATSGKVSVGCCHPFPVRDTTTAMRDAVDNAHMAVMHNGIINYCNPMKGMLADYSDSMLFASRILYPLQNELDKSSIQTLIENSTTSRLLIFRSNGVTLKFGTWHYENGVYYSNTTFMDKGRYAYYGGFWNGGYYNNGYNRLNVISVKPVNNTDNKSHAVTTVSSSNPDYYDGEDDYDDLPDDCSSGNVGEFVVLDVSKTDKSNDLLFTEICDDLYDSCRVNALDYMPSSDDTKSRTELWIETDGQIPDGITEIAGYPVKSHEIR